MSLSTSIDFSKVENPRMSFSQLRNTSFNQKTFHSENIFETKRSMLNPIEIERVRIGHELHDSVNPLLAVAKLYMDIINTITPNENTAKRKAISSIMMAIQNIRQISSELVISQTEDFSLVDMINDLVKRINDTGIFKISLCVRHRNDLKKLSSQQKLNLFRITQEQLNNTIKYSRSKFVKVVLLCKKNIVTLEISDDGVGFDPTEKVKGIGLNNIQNRIKDLNGSIEIKSSPGNGCLLQVAIPMK